MSHHRVIEPLDLHRQQSLLEPSHEAVVGVRDALRTSETRLVLQSPELGVHVAPPFEALRPGPFADRSSSALRDLGARWVITASAALVQSRCAATSCIDRPAR